MTARIAVRVQPGARREAVLGRLASGELKLAVSAPPEDGRANQAVKELLARLLGVRRAQVTLTRGASARAKRFEIEGLEPEEAERRLDAALERATGPDGQ